MPTKAELEVSLAAAEAKVKDLEHDAVVLQQRLDDAISDYNETVDELADALKQAESEDVPMDDCKCRLCNAARENAKLINSGRMSADELLAQGV